MVGMVARLSRSIPLIIALVIIALIIYAVVSYMRTPTRAKEVLIKVFTILTSVILGVFGLFALYAVVDGNTAVFELAISFAGVGAVGLAITLICRYFFKKHHPHYRKGVNVHATTKTPDGSITSRTIFWKIYDLLGKFRPKD